jgi:Fur family transcriptional regulator, peroxide stress response regulator
MLIEEVRTTLIKSGLKITPQRLAILEALHELHDHPNADNIIDYIRKFHPNVSTGTVYKTLDTFAEKGIVKKVKTDRDIMRYDAIQEKHHHLYCAESERIEDYYDNGLDELIEQYFKQKNIPGFKIKDIKLQIIGNFTTKKAN